MSAFASFVNKVKLHAETQRMLDDGEIGKCIDCSYLTSEKNDGEWQCGDCMAEATREKESEDRHNDNRRF